jgi:hypothetical protein
VSGSPARSRPAPRVVSSPTGGCGEPPPAAETVSERA